MSTDLSSVQYIVIYYGYRIKEALKKAKITIKVKDGRTYPLLQCWKSMDAFHQISDSVENLMTAEEVTHDSQQLPHGQQIVTHYYILLLELITSVANNGGRGRNR